MPFTLIQLLKDYWYIPVMLALVAVIGFYKVSNSSLEADLANAKTEYVSLVGEFEKLQVATENCNRVVDSLAKAKGDLDTSLNKANAKIKELNAQTTAQVQELRAAKVPTDCSGAMLYMGSTVQKETLKWRTTK